MKRLLVSITVSIILAFGSMNLTSCDTGNNPGKDPYKFKDTAHSYHFHGEDSTYKFYNGNYLIDQGNYIVKDSELFLLREYAYTSPEAAAAAVIRYKFTKTDTTISLSANSATITYGLEHPLASERAVAGIQAGKKWRAGNSADDMWNVWDFKADGTFDFAHYHSADHAEPRGSYSYFIQGKFLVTAAPKTASTPYEVNAYSIETTDISLALTPAPKGGSIFYTLIQDNPRDLSGAAYNFSDNGTYTLTGGTPGTYIKRDNVLVFLPDGSYGNAAAALAAAEKYAYFVNDGKISLINATETKVYTLDGHIPEARTLTDDLSDGKYWKASASDPYASNSMVNWYGFRADGSYHYYHYMSSKPDYIDRGDFSYLLKDDVLITLSSLYSPSKNPAVVAYTTAAYIVSSTDLFVTNAKWTGSSTITLTKFDGYEIEHDAALIFHVPHSADVPGSGSSGSEDSGEHHH
jgi:uncharacterized protein YjlB